MWYKYKKIVFAHKLTLFWIQISWVVVLKTKLHQICTKLKNFIKPDMINYITQYEQEKLRQVSELKNMKSPLHLNHLWSGKSADSQVSLTKHFENFGPVCLNLVKFCKKTVS